MACKSFGAMSATIQLLGRPRVVPHTGEAYQCRSRKSWALLTYLLLHERPPTRNQLASMLFSEADDPARALRWGLSEVRRALGPGGSVDGDPVVLQLPPGAVVDVTVVSRGTWTEAVTMPGLGVELLEGMTVRGAAVFDSWLLSAQRHVAAASEAILHEAALGSMAHGALDAAIGYAVRAAAMSPLDENHQALLIRLYRLSGDDDTAAKQFAACTKLFASELGAAPGPAVVAAMRTPVYRHAEIADDAAIEALVEAGAAAVSAGASEAGAASLRTAVRLADDAGATRLRLCSRLVLAETLIHSLRGFDQEGLGVLHEVNDIAQAHDLPDVAAQARAELGYVDFLRARYDRAELWLTDALMLAGSTSMTAKATTYLGSVDSDRADYPQAIVRLVQAVTLSVEAKEPRRQSFALSMLGRVSLLRRDFDAAEQQLDASIELAERDHWLSFLPWPQALRGEVQLSRGDMDGAAVLLQQAFARACHLGDPCWEGVSARALALVAVATGETERAFALLAEARSRCNRMPDPYVWLDGYILDAQCALGVQHGHVETRNWVDTLREMASRAGMKELMVRSLLHGAALGTKGDVEAAALLAVDVDNPVLSTLLSDASKPVKRQPVRPGRGISHEAPVVQLDEGCVEKG